MGTLTKILRLRKPSPDGSDPAELARIIGELADDIDVRAGGDGLTTAEIAALPAAERPGGRVVFDKTTGELKVSDGTSWYVIPRATVIAAAYLLKTDAASTYLSKTDAGSTYLTQAAAGSTYLTQLAAAATYLTKAEGLTSAAAAATYLSKAVGGTVTGNVVVRHSTANNGLSIEGLDGTVPVQLVPVRNGVREPSNALYAPKVGQGWNFAQPPRVPTPATADDAVPKKYIDDKRRAGTVSTNSYTTGGVRVNFSSAMASKPFVVAGQTVGDAYATPLVIMVFGVNTTGFSYRAFEFMDYGGRERTAGAPVLFDYVAMLA